MQTTLARRADVYEIDPDKEKLIPIYSIPSMLPERKRGPVSKRTITRWAGPGFLGHDGEPIRLPTIRCGDERFTSKQAIIWFMRAISAQ